MMTRKRHYMIMHPLFVFGILFMAMSFICLGPVFTKTFAAEITLTDDVFVDCTMSKAKNQISYNVVPKYSGKYAIFSSRTQSNQGGKIKTQLLDGSGNNIDTGDGELQIGDNIFVVGDLTAGQTYKLQLEYIPIYNDSTMSCQLTLVQYGTTDYKLFGKSEVTLSLNKNDSVCRVEVVRGTIPDNSEQQKWVLSDESVLEFMAEGYQSFEVEKRPNYKWMCTYFAQLIARKAGKATLQLVDITDPKIVYATVNITVLPGTPESDPESTPKSESESTKETTPTIKPVSIKSLKGAKKSFTVKWTPKQKDVTGYNVRYSLKSSMAKAVKKNVVGGSKKSLKVKSLKSKKKYYVQIRAYKKVGKKTYYSTWSKKKSVKVK